MITALGIARTAAVAFLALLGAGQIVRSAIVTETVDDRPEIAAHVWSGHPQVMLAQSMAEIGTAAGAGRDPAATSIDQAIRAARAAPLAIEPLLVRGALAQSEGRPVLAERAFVEAVRRDPRSSAARFFLSQRYLLTGRADEGLRHASVLARMVSGSYGTLVPAIAQYARSPGAVEVLRPTFARDAQIREGVLSHLAADSDNLSLILALAGGDIWRRDPSAAPAWQGQLLKSLVEKGDFGRARALWLKISRLPAAPAGLFNPQFARLAAPAPFNWTFGSGEFGFAEPTAVNSLQVIYYGRTNAEFANQTMLLVPGVYELRMRVQREPGGEAQSGLEWTVACRLGSTKLLTLPLGEVKGAVQALAGRFTVPAGCTAQTISLSGTAREFASSAQVRVSNFQLVRQS